MITKEHIGKTSAGEDVHAYTLTNANGLRMRVLTLGGIVTHLEVPDRDGRLDDITLGLPTLEAYLAGHPYFGALVGRVAGRLPGGKFFAEGREVQLPTNDGDNHLHGGVHALDKKVWTAEPVGENALRLRYRSPDGEEGYPGNVDIAVTYTLNDDNEWVLAYEAVTDKATPFSMTNHAYFNLAGENAGSIADHLVQIHAERYVPADKDFTLLDRVEPVNTNDFRTPRRMGDALDGLAGKHGDNYMLSDEPGVRPVARVEDPKTGRVLTVTSDAPVLQFYTGVNLTGDDIGKSGRPYLPFSALCLECQGYPAGVNDSPIGSIMLHPGERYRQRTVYAFSVKK